MIQCTSEIDYLKTAVQDSNRQKVPQAPIAAIAIDTNYHVVEYAEWTSITYTIMQIAKKYVVHLEVNSERQYESSTCSSLPILWLKTDLINWHITLYSQTSSCTSSGVYKVYGTLFSTIESESHTMQMTQGNTKADPLQEGIQGGIQGSIQEGLRFLGLSCEPFTFHLIKKAAEEGIPSAQMALYSSYVLLEDEENMVAWCIKAAENNHKVAQYTLAWWYEEGTFVAEDKKQAIKWLQKSAKAGNTDAQIKLARYYREGKIVTQDLQTAITWYSKAAEGGSLLAQSELGIWYLRGSDIHDTQKGLALLTKAAEQGEPNAQCELAICYDTGFGVPKLKEEVFFWSKKAADQGHPQAQYQLSLCYKEGIGVQPDHRKALHWCKKAAKAGNVYAYYEFAKHCEKRGNVHKAIDWYTLAAKKGITDAKESLVRVQLCANLCLHT